MYPTIQPLQDIIGTTSHRYSLTLSTFVYLSVGTLNELNFYVVKKGEIVHCFVINDMLENGYTIGNQTYYITW